MLCYRTYGKEIGTGKQKQIVLKEHQNCWYNLSTPCSHFSGKDFVLCKSILIWTDSVGKIALINAGEESFSHLGFDNSTGLTVESRQRLQCCAASFVEELV